MLAMIAMVLLPQAAATLTDYGRALTKLPRDHVRGATLVETNAKMNAAVKASTPGLATVGCADAGDMIHGVLEDLYAVRDAGLEEVYALDDDNRRLSAGAYRGADLEALRAAWASEAADDAALALHSRCHDAMKWFVHHTRASTKADLAHAGFVLPLLPTEAPPLSNGGEAAAGYDAAISCQACHASDAVRGGNNESAPFPESLSYSAIAYGSFPFWDDSAPGCASCDPGISTPSNLTVKYSAEHNSELLMHSHCADMSWTNARGAPNGSPCNHLFNAEHGAFIYTPKASNSPEADGLFCCRSYQATDENFPGAVPANWTRSMTYWGTNDVAEGVLDYYSGTIKIYWATALGVDFWYYESEDGTPLEQGEGCYFPGVHPKKACPQGLPIVLYHDYDPATFKATAHDKEEFAVPDVCLKTTTSCAAPGGSGGALTVGAKAAGVGRRGD